VINNCSQFSHQVYHTVIWENPHTLTLSIVQEALAATRFNVVINKDRKTIILPAKSRHGQYAVLRQQINLINVREFTDHRVDSADDQGYSLQQSRKSVAESTTKRRWKTGNYRPTTFATRKGPLIIGVSSPSRQLSSNIKAAKKSIVPIKSILCVGNIDPSCSVEDLCSHVTALSVRVISCFEAKQRRRRTDNENEEIVER
jgi:hypothetical protein